MLTPGSLRHHLPRYCHPLRSRRFLLRMALLERGHPKLPSDQKGVGRGILDVFCSLPDGSPRTRTPWQP